VAEFLNFFIVSLKLESRFVAFEKMPFLWKYGKLWDCSVGPYIVNNTYLKTKVIILGQFLHNNYGSHFILEGFEPALSVTESDSMTTLPWRICHVCSVPCSKVFFNHRKNANGFRAQRPTSQRRMNKRRMSECQMSKCQMSERWTSERRTSNVERQTSNIKIWLG
jgi:hypothetical protein